jgi:stage VI sporulation protein D
MDVDNRSGLLRFNIAEKMILTDREASIEMLEEIELVPSVQVHLRGDHAVLQGHLELLGTYQVSGENRSTEVQRRIPVEITLPIHRISEGSDIVIEVENFDVEVTDPRSLFVTGTIMLKGLKDVEKPREEEVSDALPEEMNFVDEAEFSQKEPVAAARGRAEEQDRAQAHAEAQAEEKGLMDLQAQHQAQDQAPGQTVRETVQRAETLAQADRDEARVEQAAVEEKVEAALDDAVENASEVVLEALEESDEAAEAKAEAETPANVKPELKIAFSAKKRENEDTAPVNLTSALQRSRAASYAAEARSAQQREAEAAEEQEMAAEAKRASSREALDWARMLRGGEDLPSPSYKLRVGLVQPDDDLDSLGSRFGVNPKELALLNQLDAERELQAGQPVLIPRTRVAPSRKEDEKSPKKSR